MGKIKVGFPLNASVALLLLASAHSLVWHMACLQIAAQQELIGGVTRGGVAHRMKQKRVFDTSWDVQYSSPWDNENDDFFTKKNLSKSRYSELTLVCTVLSWIYLVNAEFKTLKRFFHSLEFARGKLEWILPNFHVSSI